MTGRRRQHPKIGLARLAFTTIELLVVIAIIAILLSILTAGIMKVMNRQYQIQTQQDLVELAQALELFKTKFGMYPPSSLNPNNVMKVMTKMFPGMVPPVGTDPSQTILTQRLNDALKPLTNPPGGITVTNISLQGDQCLVLFLGGFHQMAKDPATNLAPPGVVVVAPQGLSEDPLNPFSDPRVPGSGGNRIGPFFKFNASRLCMRNANVPLASYGDGFYGTVYQGAARYNTCYAYFSPSGWVQGTPKGNGVGYYTDSDCNQLTDAQGGFPRPCINLKALTSNGFEYVNQKTFQIISAGPDTLFGTAYKYPASSSNPASDFAGSPGSADNFANFYESRLGES
jgi:type II secretory pathway pseudopilin PulG